MMNSASVLPLVQRVQNSISLGESHFREFKSAFEGRPQLKKPRSVSNICRDIGEALVAFANADGGDLLIGVEDNGGITGVPHCDTDIAIMKNAYKTHILGNNGFPIQRNEVLMINGQKVLYFSVSKGNGTIYQLPDGRCMRRQDKSTIPIAFHTLVFQRNEQLSREYDREFMDGVFPSDLDIALVQQIANELIPGMSPEQYLQQVGLAEYTPSGLRLRRAAVLLFAKNIQRHFPGSQVRILRVMGNELQTGSNYNVVTDEYVTGNVFTLLAKSWEMLRPFLSQSIQFGEDARFTQSFSYPENACREALINAIAHRDYYIQNPTIIYVFNDRLEFNSPGELLSTVSIAELRRGTGVHESRNLYIARTLRENQYMRELGEGIRRIIDLMSAQELAPPEITSQNGSFVISLHHKSVYTQIEQMWLSSYERYDLNSYQKKIVIAGMGGRQLSPETIYGALSSNDRDLYDRCVTTLRINGILKEIRSNFDANRLAQKTHVKKQSIARYEVVPADKIAKSEYSTKVYIYNLPSECNESTIEQAMQLFGSVLDVKLPLDESSPRKHRGYAFVTFIESDSALRAIAIKNIKVLDSIATIVSYKPISIPKRKISNSKKRDSLLPHDLQA